MNKKRVVITGLGVISANGIGKDSFWQANVTGKSGISLINSFDTRDLRTKMAAQIADFEPKDYMDEIRASKMERFSQFAVACARMAERDSGLKLKEEDPAEVGIVLGSGLGGLFFYEKQFMTIQERGPSRAHPAGIPRVMPNAPAGQVAIELKLKGPNLTISTACSSGNHAIGLAFNFIQQGKAKVMFAGGTETPIVFINYAAFDALRVMSTKNDDYEQACRPFDKERDGFVMGEGAAVLILEDKEHALKRNAPIYGEIIGYSLNSGAEHMVVPVADGEDAAESMRAALKDAGIKPDEIDYINAHGTSTQANDKAETQAIKKIFGDRARKIPVSSTKSMIGHAFGAAGALEAAVCSLILKENIIPPTINYKNADRQCDLDYVPNKARQSKVKTILSNSFAFGSNNSCLILKRFEE